MESCCIAAIEHLRIEADPIDVLHDIEAATSLIVKDGSVFEFAHKTVQEFFAASCLCELNESAAGSLLHGIVERDLGEYWLNEMNFIRQIMPYRYTKFFAEPQLRQCLSEFERATRESRKRRLSFVFGESYVNLFSHSEEAVHLGNERSVELVYMGPFSQVIEFCLSEPQARDISALVPKVDLAKNIKARGEVDDNSLHESELRTRSVIALVEGIEKAEFVFDAIADEICRVASEQHQVMLDQIAEDESAGDLTISRLRDDWSG